MQQKKIPARFRLIGTIMLIAAISSLVFLWACAGPKVYKVGILTSFTPFSEIADAFKEKMTELGYVEGKNITYDFQKRDNDVEGEKQVINKFIADKVDLILTFPTGASVTASQLTKGTKLPVLFAMAGVEGEIPVDSMNKPGGNITGVRFPGPDNVIKHMELMLEIKPKTKTIWVTYDISYPNTQHMLDALRPVVTSKGITLLEAPGKTASDVQASLDGLTASGLYKKVDAILLMPEALSLSQDGFGAIITFAKKYKIPVGAGIPPMMEAGVLFCLLPDNKDMGKLAAPLADKIFKGADPGTLPIVTPENYLFLNNKIATELGLVIPDGLLKQAVMVLK